ncbi:MAG: DUF6297 family protein [Propionibacteriaceae bacterium]
MSVANELNLAELETEKADERDLIRLMNAWRKGRATKSFWAVFTESYVTVFALVMVGAMVVSALMQTQQNAAACTDAGCLSARALLPMGATAGTLGIALFISRLFGPVVASAAEGFWLLDAPLDRRRMLIKRFCAIVAIATLGGALIGALVSTLVGASATSIVVWALATACSCAAVVTFAAAEQGAERTFLVRAGQGLMMVVTLILMTLVVAISAQWISLAVNVELSVQIGWLVAAAAAVIFVASFVIAISRLRLIRRARLQSGGSLVSGMQGAAFALDFGLMRDILVEREMITKGHVSPTRGRGSGPAAITWRDVQRLFRSPIPVLLVLASVVVPYAISALGFARMNPFLSGSILCFLLIPLLGSLRVLSRTPGLLRMMPFSTSQVRMAAVTVPAIISVVWLLLSIPAFVGVAANGSKTEISDAVTAAFCTAFAGLLGAVRWTVAKSANYQAPTMATTMGAVPPSMIFSLFKGFDMVALVTFPLVLGWPSLIGVVLGVIAFCTLIGGANMEELQAQSQRQKELAVQAKVEAAAKQRKK